MHVFHRSIEYNGELIIVDDNFCENYFHFILNDFSLIHLGKIFLEKVYFKSQILVH